MGIKSEQVTFTSSRSTDDLGRRLQHTLASLKASSIENLETSSNALSNFDDQPAIGVVAEGRGMVGGGWAVQVIVTEAGAHRQITLVALGDGGLSRAMGGMRNTVSLPKSIAKRDEIRRGLT